MGTLKPDDPYITLITALSSAIVGGGLALFGSFLNNRAAAKRYNVQLQHEGRQRKEELFRERGEELYTLMATWLRHVGVFQLNMIAVMYGTMKYDQAMQAVAKHEVKLDFDRIRMLVGAYFPQLEAQYEDIERKRDAADEVRLDFKQQYDRLGEKLNASQFADRYEKAQLEMATAGEKFLKELAERIRGLSN